MKKFNETMKKIGAAVMALTVAACGLVGCKNGNSDGGSDDPINGSDDPAKQQIVVYAVDNGMGYKWAEKMAADFNALPENSAYQVLVQHGAKDLLTTMNDELKAGSTDVSIYFGCQSSITTMIRDGRFVDISDVYKMKPNGDEKTIGDKTIDFQLYKEAYSDLNGNGIYAVPYSTGMAGMLFDYEFFLENDYLTYAKTDEQSAVEAQGCKVKVEKGKLVATEAFGNYAAGDKILTKGKDGKYGTYDDGQAITEDEFFTMIKKIIDNGHSPFVYTTNSVEAYTPVIYQGMMAQNMGYENFYNFMALKGEIQNKSGSAEANITPATGADAWTTDVVKNAYQAGLEFYYRTIIGNVGKINGSEYKPADMLHKSCVNSSSLTHLEAQDKFISGHYEDVGYSAFLIEGTWWENEAKGTFENLTPIEDEPRGFGQREYRYYLYPVTDTQVTANNKSVMAVQDDGCGVLFDNERVYKSLKDGITKEAYIQKCKEFLAYTLSDDCLEYYTTSTGNPRPFDYEVSAENLAKMTPFQRNCWAITHDTENVSIVYPNVLNNLCAVRSLGKLNNFKASESVTTPYGALNRNRSTQITLDAYVDAVYKYVAKNYAGSYNVAKDYIR